jgi:hypothetical protein
VPYANKNFAIRPTEFGSPALFIDIANSFGRQIVNARILLIGETSVNERPFAASQLEAAKGRDLPKLLYRRYFGSIQLIESYSRIYETEVYLRNMRILFFAFTDGSIP